MTTKAKMQSDAYVIAGLMALTGRPPKELAAMLVNAAKVFGGDDGEEVALDFINPHRSRST